jgi:hypothetical protein
MPTPPLRLSCSQGKSIGSLRSNGRKQSFLCRQLRFQVRLFLLCVFLHRPHGLAQDTSPPFVVPSEDHSHEGGLGARLFREGRRTKDAQQSRKKKHMKTTSQKNQIGLKSKSAQLSSTPETQGAVAPAQVERKDNRLPIDTEARKKNRTLPTPKVLELLKASNPGLFNLAEVVGKWVWVTFRETPAPELRQILAQLGFHWNRERQAWQHPCGAFRLRGFQDPHEKYPCYFPADSRAA